MNEMEREIIGRSGWKEAFILGFLSFNYPKRNEYSFSKYEKIMEWWIKQRMDIELVDPQMQSFNVVIFSLAMFVI